jgi:hypothetical protein
MVEITTKMSRVDKAVSLMKMGILRLRIQAQKRFIWFLKPASKGCHAGRFDSFWGGALSSV